MKGLIESLKKDVLKDTIETKTNYGAVYQGKNILGVNDEVNLEGEPLFIKGNLYKNQKIRNDVQSIITNRFSPASIGGIVYNITDGDTTVRDISDYVQIVDHVNFDSLSKRIVPKNSTERLTRIKFDDYGFFGLFDKNGNAVIIKYIESKINTPRESKYTDFGELEIYLNQKTYGKMIGNLKTHFSSKSPERNLIEHVDGSSKGKKNPNGVIYRLASFPIKCNKEIEKDETISVIRNVLPEMFKN